MLRALLLLIAIVGAAHDGSAQELEGRLKQIYDTGIIRLAYRSDAKPFSFTSQNGEPDGYTIDLCKFIVGALGRQLNKNLSTEWVPVDSQNRFDSIAAGVADIECGSSSVSFGRMTKVDFSSFIFMENTGLIVRIDSGISSFGDLKGKKIAVIVGTTNEAALTREIQRRQIQTAVIQRPPRRHRRAAKRRRGKLRQRQAVADRCLQCRWIDLQDASGKPFQRAVCPCVTTRGLEAASGRQQGSLTALQQSADPRHLSEMVRCAGRTSRSAARGRLHLRNHSGMTGDDQCACCWRPVPDGHISRLLLHVDHPRHR